MEFELLLTWLLIIVVGTLFVYTEYVNKNSYKNPVFFYCRLMGSMIIAVFFIYEYINSRQPHYVIFGILFLYDVFNTWQHHHTGVI